jgi:hypothetical protein
MSMPRFTAEASLNSRSGISYRGTSGVTAARELSPQLWQMECHHICDGTGDCAYVDCTWEDVGGDPGISFGGGQPSTGGVGGSRLECLAHCVSKYGNNTPKYFSCSYGCPAK